MISAEEFFIRTLPTVNFFCLQEMKKAILSDMTKLGKEAGLKSFEQVTAPRELRKGNDCVTYLQACYYQGNVPLLVIVQQSNLY